MLTNLLASLVITLVTNTTERVSTHVEHDWEMQRVAPDAYCIKHVPDSDPKKKWIRTTIKEVSTIHFDYDRTQVGVKVDEKLISDSEVEMDLLRIETWAPLSTNQIPEGAWLSGSEWIKPVKFGTGYGTNLTAIGMTMMDGHISGLVTNMSSKDRDEAK